MQSNPVLPSPRSAALLNRFPGNVREGLLEALLADIWASLQAHLAEPVRARQSRRWRTVTFMGAARFTVDKESGRIGVMELVKQADGRVGFASVTVPTVIDLPGRVNGFWLDAFLVPWGERIAECFIDHQATGSDLSWYAALKRELQRALVRGTHWYGLRCRLRDAFGLDPEIVLWCRKGRPPSRDYVSHAMYNGVLGERAAYRRIQDDNPNLVWLYNVLRAGGLDPGGSEPVAEMKARLLAWGGVGEAGWRRLANAKERDFRHIIGFVDADGRTACAHEYLPKWLRVIGNLRRDHAVPRPLTGLFEHDTYDGRRASEGSRVRFRGVWLHPGTLNAILDEGERRLANASHKRFIEEDVVEVLTWLKAEQPVLQKNQLRLGWKYLAARAAAWRVEREACDTLKDLAWDSLLPQTEIGPWRIVPLTDAWQLRREALAQRHCADGLLEECLNGTNRLFSVRNAQGKCLATIGIERAEDEWKVFGFRGFANRQVPDALLGLDREVLRRYGDLWRLSGGGGEGEGRGIGGGVKGVDGSNLAGKTASMRWYVDKWQQWPARGDQGHES